MDTLDPIRFRTHTFGCKVNTYDTGLLEGRLQTQGFTVAEKEPQVHILNTCAVTREATREAARLARRLKIQNPLSLVVLTGCAAQVDTEELATVKGVDLVVANSHKSELGDLIRRYYSGELRERIHKSNIFKKEDLEEGGGLESSHTRSFLKIQDGCNSFCTFCVIPFARGKSRSLSIQNLVRRVRELESKGVKEAVLTGVHIADYQDEDKGLEDLVEALLAKTSMARFRLTSLEPLEVSPRLLDLYQDPRLCPHFHMSIQAASTKVLREMKRKYTARDVQESLVNIAERVPGVFLGLDVIAGFPGESDEEFLETLEVLKASPWTRLHVFPYSRRPGTIAGRRDDEVPPSSISLRARLLRELSDQRFAERQAMQLGSRKRALALRGSWKATSEIRSGVNPEIQLLSRDYWTITGDFDVEANTEIDVEIAAIGPNGRLIGNICASNPL
ncbi:MAG: tRNA (N(6)-L-threonylcarbamoyladenosine(37)-C(2))-methylthiotransferase MtaB [Bdellovibrionales bacterium]